MNTPSANGKIHLIAGAGLSGPGEDADGPATFFLRTDTGLTAEVSASREAARMAVDLVESFLAGANVLSIPALWNQLSDEVRDLADTRSSRQAVALIDIAAWDLRGQADALALHKMLGGETARGLPVACAPDLATPDLLEWMEQARKSGFGAMMLTLGQDDDAERFEAARRLLSRNRPVPDLLARIPERFSPEEAVRRVLFLEADFDLACVQAPVRSLQSEAFTEVAAGLCPAEPARSVQAMFSGGLQSATEIVRIDPVVSGITGSMQIADAAYGYELPVIIAAGPDLVGVQLSAVIPTAMYIEVDSTNALGLQLENGRLSPANLTGASRSRIGGIL